MRLLTSALVAGLTLVAGTAAAGAVSVPPVPTVPTPTLPSVTVPVPTPPHSVPAPVPPPVVPKPPAVPKPPPPPPVATVTTQAQSAVSSVTQTATGAAHATTTGASSSGSAAAASAGPGASVGNVTVYSGSGAASGGSGGVYSGSASPTSASGSPSGMRVDHFQSSRGWIGTKGPKKRRATTLTFVLPHAGRVILIVNQLSPECLGVGHLTVHAHAGLNRVRFAGRVHGRQLKPGTYRISIRTPSGRVVRRVTLVVVDGSAPSRAELQSLRAANTCTARAEQASLISSGGDTGSGSTPSGGSGHLAASPQSPGPGLGIEPPSAPHGNSGVLGSSIQETARAIRPLLVALLALSILLLGVASLPRVAVPDPRMHDALARYRVEIAGLGAAALVAVAIAIFIG